LLVEAALQKGKSQLDGEAVKHPAMMRIRKVKSPVTILGHEKTAGDELAA
jgi:hypothetical protein